MQSRTLRVPVSKPDIFTEPDNVDPDTLANLGPLRRLAGLWRADKGVDVNPKAEGPERRVFIETVRMDPIDPQTNGPQLFYGLRYHVHINTPEEDITFHDQVGYWLWEPATGLIMQTLAIPRGQVLLAGGHAGPDDRKFFVEAKRGDTRYGICSTEFLEEGISNRQLSHRHHLQRRRKLDLSDPHHTRGRRRQQLRPPRHEHAEAGGSATAEPPCPHSERARKGSFERTALTPSRQASSKPCVWAGKPGRANDQYSPATPAIPEAGRRAG